MNIGLKIINKNLLTASVLVLLFGQLLSAQNPKSYGLKVIAGGRYDNLRMCVGSAAGVKGGPIADIMLLMKTELPCGRYLALELPVMRPILFGAAFGMLQFEPQAALEFRRDLDGRKTLLLAPGLGLSLHYGPDYRSDLDNRGEDFFAAGPFLSTLIGLERMGSADKPTVLGIRFFYSPLFASQSELSPGTVLGAALEWQRIF